MECHILRSQRLRRSLWNQTGLSIPSQPLFQRAMRNDLIEGHEPSTYITLITSSALGKAGSPTGREPYGDGAIVVVRARESRAHIGFHVA